MPIFFVEGDLSHIEIKGLDVNTKYTRTTYISTTIYNKAKKRYFYICKMITIVKGGMGLVIKKLNPPQNFTHKRLQQWGKE